MSRRTAAWLAWSIWAIAVALTALSLVLMVLNLSHPNVHVFDWWLGNTLVVVDATVGALIASRRPENPVGWLLCLSGVAVGTSSFTAQYAIYALLARPGSLPAGEALAWIFSWLLPIMIGLQVFYVLLFPSGRLPGRRWRPLAWLTVAFVVVGVISSGFSSGPIDALGSIRNPLGMEGFSKVYDAVLFFMAPVLFVGAALSVFVRLRRTAGVERQQIKWFAYAAAIYAVSIILNVIVLATDTPPWFERITTTFFTAAGTTIPIAIGIAILRYRLYEIDRIINRTLVYGPLTVSLTLAYVGIVFSLQSVFRSLTGETSQLVIVASTLAIAALFSPLRRRIQTLVDRRFYRKKYDARKTLEAFGALLRDGPDLETTVDELVAVAHETVQPTHVSLWLRSPGFGTRVPVE
ncbi:MAG: hypothetical protein ACRDTR_17810 [Rubrobacter sp.]